MTTTRSIPRRIAGAALLALALVLGSWTTTTQHASALAPNTVFFPNLAKCQAAKPIYSNSFTRITQDCTYSGAMLGPIKLQSGPYFLVYTTR